MSKIDTSVEAVERIAAEYEDPRFTHYNTYAVAQLLRALRTELTATQEKLAAAETAIVLKADYIVRQSHEAFVARQKMEEQLTTAQAQIDAARNEGLDLAIAHFRSTFINNRTIGRVLAELEALKSTAPVRNDAKSSADHRQQRGVAWDIVDEAINSYDSWMLDDDYECGRVLREIIGKMRDRRAAFNTQDKP